MSVVAYTLMLFGCADDGTACERLAVPAQVYAAAAQCEAQVEPALGSELALRADFPVVEARCVKLDRRAAAGPRGGRIVAAR